MKLSLDTITKRIEELTEGCSSPSAPASPAMQKLIDAGLSFYHAGREIADSRYCVEDDCLTCDAQAVLDEYADPRSPLLSSGTNPLSLELIAAYSFIVSVLNFPRRLPFDCHCPECNTERLIIADATAAYERALDTGTNEDDGGASLRSVPAGKEDGR